MTRSISAVGRFLQPDSVVPDYADPQALNRYSYVLNNPLRYTDPSGQLPTSADIVGFVGGWVGRLGPPPTATPPPSVSGPAACVLPEPGGPCLPGPTPGAVLAARQARRPEQILKCPREPGVGTRASAVLLSRRPLIVKLRTRTGLGIGPNPENTATEPATKRGCYRWQGCW